MRDRALILKIIAAWEEAKHRGKIPSLEDLCEGDPEVLAEVRAELARRYGVVAGGETLEAPVPGKGFEPFFETSDEPPADPPAGPPPGRSAGPPHDNAPPPSSGKNSDEHPNTIGRYRVIRVLGRGGFGVVYLGHDDMLDRPVAIKVPTPDRISRPKQAEEYLAEARLVASLDHHAIVRVYDCGQTDSGACYVVSQFIDGSDLAHALKRGRVAPAWTAEVVSRVAEALHAAHKKKIIHRDVKPANILLDGQGKAFLTDFGIALRDQDFGRGSGYCGTPRYMSPEQARGEGHRVDGRADVFSLGVTMYEMLTGSPPYNAANLTDLLEQIESREATPPRQLDENTPVELERIVLRALAKRASDRYSSAADFAEDLRIWQGKSSSPAIDVPVIAGTPSRPSEKTATPPLTPATDGSLPFVVPKGLLAFDAGDADFFLDLLPGPRDRDGLPPGVRFWRDRLEATDPDAAFQVGLLYGPTGCGKSSLMRAGIVPRLRGPVDALVVEATGADTERRLVRAIRRHLPDAPVTDDLPDLFAWLRRRPDGPKIVIVLDQFEQWLFAHPDPAGEPLVLALRHCDGVRVQAVTLVRDDFWMAATRFFHALEVPLEEGKNSAAADLFDPRHARRVLSAYGRAFSAIGDRPTADQQRFIAEAVDGLTENGQVVAVRIGLFAEMTKARPWTPATLKQVGGATGVGIAFLEETFGAGAPAGRKPLIKPAISILTRLLPDPGSSIRGRLRNEGELRVIAGPNADAVLRWLDAELRLITPAGAEDGGAGYQLTHDYLVPAIRTWLDQTNRSTRAGRAKLLLQERAAQWSMKPTSRNLPSVLEWMQLRWRTRRADWTPPQAAMMGRAGRRLAAQSCIVVLLAVATAIGVEFYGGSFKAHALVETIARADFAQLPEAVRGLRFFSWWKGPAMAVALQGDPANLRLQIADADGDFDRLMALEKSDRADVQYAVRSLLADLKAKASTLRDGMRSIASNRQSSSDLVGFAVAYLFAIGESDPLIELFSDPTPSDKKTEAVHRLGHFKVSPKQLLDLASKSPAARYPALLALGACEPLSDLTEPVATMYESETDPGCHSALRWILGTRLGKADEVARIDQKRVRKQPGSAKWFVDPVAGTMTVIPEGSSVVMGEGKIGKVKNEVLHTRKISRRFAIGLSEVSVGDYKRLRLLREPEYDPKTNRTTKPIRSDDCPAPLSWYYAAEYCNWLTEQAGLGESDLCFIRTELQDEKGKTKKNRQGEVVYGYQLHPDALTRRGYRMPTEAEWEYAARAGSRTAYFTGDKKTFLHHYGHFRSNRLNAVGTLMPNPLGLFDVIGNAREWCLEPYMPEGMYPYKAAIAGATMNDNLLLERATPGVPLNRGVRGGCYYEEAEDQYSARRFRLEEQYDSVEVGLRLARTLRPED